MESCSDKMNVSSITMPFCFKSKRFGITNAYVRAYISKYRSYGFFVDSMVTNKRGYVAIKMIKRYGRR